MEIKLNIKAFDKLYLPLSHHHILQGFIYALIDSERRYSSFLHNTGYQTNSRTFKGFVFGSLTGRYTIEEKTIIFDSDAGLVIRSPLDDFIFALIKGCTQKKYFYIAKNKVFIDSFTVTKTPEVGASMIVETLSPVSVHLTDVSSGSSRIQYLSPLDKDFSRLAEDNARRKIKAISDLSPDFALSIISHADCTYKKYVTKFKDSVYITAYQGRFSLNGSPEALKLLYDLGIGSNNSQGFGLFKKL